ncbi:type II toxin-antitoxin system RelE/ParE family toxin [Sorangium sp. So ce1335]|uniref:type II toxin-antitoxin system RelE/ParE family toxin n=1 Tax=Sorangium sp. So ce1335 TaxID=3133335 RepID=UPI003F636B30
MTLRVIFHELAEVELNETAAYDARARPGLGDAFVAEVQGAVDALAASPLTGRAVENDVRWWLVRRFPYSALYSVRDDHIRILARAPKGRGLVPPTSVGYLRFQ